MLEVTLAVGWTAPLEEIPEWGEELDSYTRCTAIVELAQEDMEKLRISEGCTVRLETDEGCVAVKAVRARATSRAGIAILPTGPWSNFVICDGTEGTGLPPFKEVRARINPSPGEEIPSATEMMQAIYSKFAREKR